MYFLVIQQDIASEFHPPQLKHEVLVEGRVAESPWVCGKAFRLSPCRSSVLKEIQPGLQYPAAGMEPGIEAPPAPREPGPSPYRHSEVAGAPREPLAGPHEFTVLYAFDDDHLESRHAGHVVGESGSVRPGDRRLGNVKVAGYRATTLLSSGDRLVEKAGLAEKRAQNIATLLRGLGVAGVTVEWKNEPEPADGRTGPFQTPRGRPESPLRRLLKKALTGWNACPTMFCKLLILHGGVGGFASDLPVAQPFSAPCLESGFAFGLIG